MTRRIDLENHFASEAWVAAMLARDAYPRLRKDADGKYQLCPVPGVERPFGVLEKLLDLGEGRIARMDKAAIDVAVLSLVPPGTDVLPLDIGARVARQTNDDLAEAVARFPDRFQGFAALAPKDVDTATRELERCIKDLGFKGWNTYSNFGDSFLDEKRYWPLLAKAEELDCPIYLHPNYPIITEFSTYGLGVAGPSFGFGAETSLVMMRMIVAGVFDAFPRLKIILGHYGEGFPFMLDRVDRPYAQHYVPLDLSVAPQLARMPSDYLRDNMVSTTSGNYSTAAFLCTRMALGAERMALGTDYPFEEMTACIDFLNRQSMEKAEWERLYWQTAAGLGFGRTNR